MAPILPTHERNVIRFWSKVLKIKTGCWLRTGATLPNGYGTLEIFGRTEYAHRYSYMIAKGEIPKGLDVCHTCDNRWCVNPDHLYLGTRKDNMQDCVARGRTNKPKGEKSYNAKLTSEQVIEIRRIAKDKTMLKHLLHSQIADKFNVSRSTIRHIIYGKSWKSLLNDKKAVTALEYGILAALIAVVIIGSVTNVGKNISSSFSKVAASITTANAK